MVLWPSGARSALSATENENRKSLGTNKSDHDSQNHEAERRSGSTP